MCDYSYFMIFVQCIFSYHAIFPFFFICSIETLETLNYPFLNHWTKIVKKCTRDNETKSKSLSTRLRHDTRLFFLGWIRGKMLLALAFFWCLVGKILCENNGRIDISDANRWMEGTMFVSRSSETKIKWLAQWYITVWKIEQVLQNKCIVTWLFSLKYVDVGYKIKKFSFFLFIKVE